MIFAGTQPAHRRVAPCAAGDPTGPPQRGQLAKANTGIGKEQDDQSVGPILALVEAAVLTDFRRFASAWANACTCSCVRYRRSVATTRGKLISAAGFPASRPSLTAVLTMSENTR